MFLPPYPGRALIARQRRLSARLGAALVTGSVLLALCACGDDEVTSPGTPAAQPTIASVEYVGNRAALFLDTGAAQRTQVVFSGATDPIPGNSPLVPALVNANLLALGPLAWSPTGAKLAMVATVAFDQSEVVVTGGDGGAPRIASPNTQIILSTPDWSPDETRLVYAMSTISHARGVDLFVTDLTTNQVQRLTTGLNYSQVGGAVRFSSDGRFVFYSRPVAETGAPLFDKICEVWRIEVATGERVRLAEGIAGSVQAISRSGTWALVARRTGVTPTGDYAGDLVRVPLAGTAPETILMTRKQVQHAHLTSDDLRAVVTLAETVAAGTVEPSFLYVPAVGGAESPVRGTGSKTIVADMHFPR